MAYMQTTSVGGVTFGTNWVGMVCAFSKTAIPTDWLHCDGSNVSRSTYADLYSVIGTTWGAGDGNTTITIENHDDDATLCDTITLADSSRAAAGANYSASTVSTNDMLHINVTAVATDPPEGIIVTLGFAHTVS